MSTAPAIVTIGDYLALEAQSETKHEYYYGDVIAMAGSSPRHSLISSNLITELNVASADGPCQVHTNDLRVRTLTGNYAYPDVTVVCAEPAFTDERPPSLLNPRAVFEILSPTTEARDRGAKFRDYQSIASLREYVLVSQDWQLVEQFTRQEGTGNWLLQSYDDPAAPIKLQSLGIEFTMSRLYRKTDVPLHPLLSGEASSSPG